MDDENAISAEASLELAKTNPIQWVKDALDAAGLDYTSIDELEDCELTYGGLELIYITGEGGNEGGGEHVERTFAIAPPGSPSVNGRVRDAVAYVEAYGYYASYDGTTWDNDWAQVEPADVMVVQYHKVG